MRFRPLLAAFLGLSALCALPATGAAQDYGSRTVRVTARLTIPEVLILRPVAEAVASWQGSTYTEYQLRVAIAANTDWVLVATSLPEGVTLLAEDGYYRREADVVADHGPPVNLHERVVRVRVGEHAPDTWEMQLRLALRSAREAR